MSLSHASLTWEYFPELIYDIEKNIKRNCVSYFTRECVLQVQKIRDEPWYEYEYTKTEKCSVVFILVERKMTRGPCNSRRETSQHITAEMLSVKRHRGFPPETLIVFIGEEKKKDAYEISTCAPNFIA